MSKIHTPACCTGMLTLLEARNDARAEHQMALAARDSFALKQSGPRYASALRALDEAGALWAGGSSGRYEAALSNEDRAAIEEWLEERKRARLNREKAEREKSWREQQAADGGPGRAQGGVARATSEAVKRDE